MSTIQVNVFTSLQDLFQRNCKKVQADQVNEAEY